VKPYEVRFTKEAVKDFHKLTPKLQEKLKEILQQSIAKDPHCGKRLVGDLAGSTRIASPTRTGLSTPSTSTHA
jgi:mRNA-degrading endonuclease RelE of RelBE toxin-antitoxin system